jgi:hypothetical protein
MRVSGRWVTRRLRPPIESALPLAGAPGGCKHPAVPPVSARASSPAARSSHHFGVVSRASGFPSGTQAVTKPHVASQACASTNAGRDLGSGTHLLFADCAIVGRVATTPMIATVA